MIINRSSVNECSASRGPGAQSRTRESNSTLRESNRRSGSRIVHSGSPTMHFLVLPSDAAGVPITSRRGRTRGLDAARSGSFAELAAHLLEPTFRPRRFAVQRLGESPVLNRELWTHRLLDLLDAKRPCAGGQHVHRVVDRDDASSGRVPYNSIRKARIRLGVHDGAVEAAAAEQIAKPAHRHVEGLAPAGQFADPLVESGCLQLITPQKVQLGLAGLCHVETIHEGPSLGTPNTRLGGGQDATASASMSRNAAPRRGRGGGAVKGGRPGGRR